MGGFSRFGSDEMVREHGVNKGGGTAQGGSMKVSRHLCQKKRKWPKKQLEGVEDSQEGNCAWEKVHFFKGAHVLKDKKVSTWGKNPAAGTALKKKG